MPRRPTTRPSEPIIGCARTWTRRSSPSGRTIRYSWSKARPELTESSIACRSASRSSGWIVREVRVERAVEVERVDAMDAMELVAPLHGVPVRRSHSQLPTFASASLSRTRASTSARLACARRCSVMSRPISTDATGS